MFTDLLNFDDPLNIAAAEHYQRDKDAFRLKTKQWVVKYAKRWNPKLKKIQKITRILEIPGILSGYEQYLCFCHLYTMSWFIKLSQSSTLKLFFLWQKNMTIIETKTWILVLGDEILPNYLTKKHYHSFRFFSSYLWTLWVFKSTSVQPDIGYHQFTIKSKLEYWRLFLSLEWKLIP